MPLCVLILSTLALIGCDAPLIRDATKAVRNSQKNPDAVQFKELTHCPDGNGVSGLYNATDEFGNYRGYEVFVYEGGELALGGHGNTAPMDRCYTHTRGLK
jgi:hypothetical protein